jgi:hypothetical protein
MRQDRWGDKVLFESKVYPKLAGIAHIEGDVVTAVTINREGKAEKARSFSGPPPLRAWADSAAISLKFDLTPEDGNGPWLFFLTFHFDLKARTVTGSPTPKSEIPYEQLKLTPNGPAIAP